LSTLPVCGDKDKWVSEGLRFLLNFWNIDGLGGLPEESLSLLENENLDFLLPVAGALGSGGVEL
jgi:hypothetical protein